MTVGNGALHRVGVASPGFDGTQKPPMPAMDASVAPRMCGAVGTKLANGMGMLAMSLASWCQSCNERLTRLFSHMRSVH
jgi:hypothetical protein